MGRRKSKEELERIAQNHIKFLEENPDCQLKYDEEQKRQLEELRIKDRSAADRQLLKSNYLDQMHRGIGIVTEDYGK